MELVEVLLTFPLDEKHRRTVAAVGERVRLIDAAGEYLPIARALLSGQEPPPLPPELEQLFARAEVMLAWRVLPGIASVAPRLRWVQLLSAGVDHVPQIGDNRVVVTNASGIHAVPISEYVLGVMLVLAKRLHLAFDSQRQKRWQRFGFTPSELEGKTLGIIGLGHIGRAVARLGRAFGMRVVAMKRTPGAEEDVDELLPADRLHDLLAQSDFVVLAVPLTHETRQMIDEAALRSMKRGACLVNIARGAVVDEEALSRALREEWIAGAALDVFEKEPLPEDSSLWGLENVIITPHMAGGSERYMERAVALFADNLRRYLAGEPLRNVVDLERGY